MFKITRQFIAGACSNAEVYRRGQRYFEEGAVKGLLYDEKLDCVQATVDGSKSYSVQIFFNERGEVADAGCECPAFFNYPGYCKHIVAVLLAIAGHDRHVLKTAGEAVVEELFNCLAATNTGGGEKKELQLQVIIDIQNRYDDYGEIKRSVSLKAGEEKIYVVRDIQRFIAAVARREQLYFGRSFTYDPAVHVFSPGAQKVMDFLIQLEELSRPAGMAVYFSVLRGKEARLTDEQLRRLLMQLVNYPFTLQLQGKRRLETTVTETDPPLCFTLQDDRNSLVLALADGEEIEPLTEEYDFIMLREKVYHLSGPRRAALPPILRALAKSDYKLTVKAPQIQRFLSEVLPHLEASAALHYSSSLRERLYRPPLEAKVFFDYSAGSVTARLDFVYGELTVNPFTTQAPPEENGRLLVRDAVKEQQVLFFFEQAEFKIMGGVMHLDDDERIWRFVHETLPALQQYATVYYSDRFRQAGTRQAPRFTGRVGIDWKLDLLELELELEGVDPEELEQVWQSIREKRRYHRLRDGSLLPLEGEVVKLAGLAEALDLQPSDLKQGKVRLPKRQALYLDHLIREQGFSFFRQSCDLEELVRLIRCPEKSGCPPPPSLQGVLREYQKTGYQWLKSLARCGFGGILADDMGLGKTVQAIAFILSQRLEQPAPLPPALVVAPASLIYNWAAELHKFAPELKVLVVAGTRQERREMLSRVGDMDVVITSYPLLRRDITGYAALRFSCCFFDEAQYIKNPHAQTAQCARKIKADHIFALTGTPLENSLAELWSIFQCIMPGYLQSYQKFMRKYGAPAAEETGRHEGAVDSLAAKVRPFILRRLKEDVLEELPPKIEHRLLSELTLEQKKLYAVYLERVRGAALRVLREEGFTKNRIKILAGLTRLRQICCHPALFVENYRGESAKLLQLRELLRDAVSAGHRLLLFSQFTAMLQLIKDMLEREGYAYLYLDGAVKTEDRLQLVEAFNGGQADIFLISLKAGGTGLNLTGADIVVQYDLWWNPAVEEQAAGRAHRIGQEKVVQVIKLLAKDTIEEKIFDLQQKKKELFDRVIQPGETFLSAMSEADIREILEL